MRCMYICYTVVHIMSRLSSYIEISRISYDSRVSKYFVLEPVITIFQKAWNGPNGHKWLENLNYTVVKYAEKYHLQKKLNK